MGIYMTPADAENELSPTTLVALFDDGNVGVADDGQVALTIDDAEGLVDASLAVEYPLPLPTLSGGRVDRLLRRVTKLYFRSLAFGRHPEYLQGYGEKESKTALDRADTLMAAVKAAVRELPDMKAAIKPGNIGGIVIDSGLRTFADGPNGENNLGDF